MQNRILGRLVIGSLLMCTALAGATAVFTPNSAVAAKQATSPAVHAIELALKGEFSDAGPLAQRSGDEAAVKLVELLYLRDHWDDAGYGRIMKFLNAAPKWPLADMLMKRAEQSLYKNREPADRVLSHFAKRQPISTEGRLALARANIATGNTQAARDLIKKVWNDPAVDAALEKSVASEFGSLLSADDHKRRMWRMVYAQEIQCRHSQFQAPRQRLSKCRQGSPGTAAQRCGRRQEICQAAGGHARAVGHEVCDGPLPAEAGTLFKGAGHSCDHSQMSLRPLEMRTPGGWNGAS